MATLRELNQLVPLLQDEANVGLELVDRPLEHLEHGDDVDLLELLDECELVDWHAPPPPPHTPPRRVHRKRLFADTTITPEKHAVVRCRCRKTRCLKLYCECYAAGTACTSTCRCTDCSNFDDAPPRKVFKPCTCKLNKCKKGYCDCFAAGRACTHACQCQGCENCG